MQYVFRSRNVARIPGCRSNKAIQALSKVWDAVTGLQALTLQGHTSVVYSVAFSPDGKRLASASGDGVKVWDAAAGKETLSLKGHATRVQSVVFSPDGKRLASGSG